MYNGNYEVASLVYIYICICMFKNDIFPCARYGMVYFVKYVLLCLQTTMYGMVYFVKYVSYV